MRCFGFGKKNKTNKKSNSESSESSSIEENKTKESVPTRSVSISTTTLPIPDKHITPVESAQTFGNDSFRAFISSVSLGAYATTKNSNLSKEDFNTQFVPELPPSMMAEAPIDIRTQLTSSRSDSYNKDSLHTSDASTRKTNSGGKGRRMSLLSSKSAKGQNASVKIDPGDQKSEVSRCSSTDAGTQTS